MTPPVPPPDPGKPDQVIRGHNYDGIKEYDNPMPGWWVWMFWASVVFAIIYPIGLHGLGWINTYADDLADGQAELQHLQAAAQTGGGFTADEAVLATYVGDPAHEAAGNEIYQTSCMPCHGDAGQGLIGPNLTDAYWIHGNQNLDLFTIITNGVPEKGMAPWESTLSGEQRAQLVAFIRTLAGTNPPNAKAPQGTQYPPAQ